MIGGVFLLGDGWTRQTRGYRKKMLDAFHILNGIFVSIAVTAAVVFGAPFLRNLRYGPVIFLGFTLLGITLWLIIHFL